jgi:tetratricopeptide (TPR) repeat protein
MRASARIANDLGDVSGGAGTSSGRWRSIRPISTCSGAAPICSSASVRLQQAIEVGEYVVARDPVNPSSLLSLAYVYRLDGRYDDAIGRVRTALSLSPGRASTHFGLGTALLFKGDAAGALSEMEQETSEIWQRIGLPMAYHALGRKADSDAALATLIAKGEKDCSLQHRLCLRLSREADKAFEWLDKAAQYADPGMSEVATENTFDNIHKDPRWLPFLRKIGRAPEQLAAIKFEVKLPAEPSAGIRRPMTERTFLAELKRRNVIRVAIAYVAVSWLLMQAGTLLFQTLELSNAVSKGCWRCW